MRHIPCELGCCCRVCQTASECCLRAFTDVTCDQISQDALLISGLNRALLQLDRAAVCVWTMSRKSYRSKLFESVNIK